MKRPYPHPLILLILTFFSLILLNIPNTALANKPQSPMDVAWNELYHSNGDPTQEFVPDEAYTFRDVHNSGDVYDDTAVRLTIMADDNNLNSAYIRYWITSDHWQAFNWLKDWSGAFHGQAGNDYEMWQASIPTQATGITVYYRIQLNDTTPDPDDTDWIFASDPNNGNRWKNLLGQWVGDTDTDDHDWSYTVEDDDINGPQYANITWDGSKMCARVYDSITVSGDNDSGINSVQLRYGTETDVNAGAGTTTPMSVTTGDTYCSGNVTFTNPTYYRIEAENNDFDNAIANDRDSSVSPTACEGAACNGAGTDGNVWWSEVHHDTRDSSYRTPFSAVPTGQPVTIQLRTAANDLTAATLVVYNSDSGTIWNVNSSPTTNGNYDTYQFTIPAQTTTRILSYKFRLQDGGDCDWYVDDHAHNSYDHEDRYENGTGMMVNGLNGDPCSNSANGYANNSFNITVYDAAFTTPDWAKTAVIYQIMPDRFRNGDPTNDTDWPAGYDVYGTAVHNHTTWNEAPDDTRDSGGSYYNKWSADFFGGDLQGIIDELDYLESIGVTALYLNPIFASPSNHGYDTTDYLNINPRYGDNALFATLAAEAEARGMKIILDGVFNHTGSDSVYFDRYTRWDASGNASTASDNSGACENQASTFNAFYTFNPGTTGPCSRTDGNQQYDSWWGYDSLPLLNENTAVKDFVFDYSNDDGSPTAVVQYWYDQGADGWRFDVADEVSHTFWQDFRAQIKGNDSLDGPLYTEVWYEAQPWLAGDQMDATMNYRYRKAVLGFLIDSTWTDNDNNGDQTMWTLTPSEFDYVLGSIREDYPAPAWQMMMNLMDSHDTNRAPFVLSERSDNQAEALAKMEMMAALQFTYPGAPTIYYGDEVGLGSVNLGGQGLWGAGKNVGGNVQDDPYNRHTYPWENESGALPAGLPATDLQNSYRILALTRNSYDVLQTGDVTTLLTDDANNIYAYARTDSNGAPQCAIAIFNRDGASAHTINLTVPAACEGTTFYDVLNNGSPYAATGSSLATVTLGALKSAVLVPAFGTPATLPAASVTTNSASNKIATGGTTAVSATIYDINGNPLPSGIAVNFTILNGGGSLSSPTAVTNGSGIASINYTGAASTAVAVVKAAITSPNGVAYSDSSTIFVGYTAVTIDNVNTVETGIGPESVTIDGILEVIKRGNGEPIVTVARLAGIPNQGNNVSQYVDIHLDDTAGVTALDIEFAYTDGVNESNYRLYWFKYGTGWLEIPASVPATDFDVVQFTITNSTTPSLSDLNGTPFVIGNPPAVPTAVSLQTINAQSETAVFLWLAFIGIAMLIAFALRMKQKG